VWDIGSMAVRQMGRTKYLTVTCACGIRLTEPCFIQKRHVVKEAHSVSFENFYLVMFYGNQII
jgi:hypothetical protein